jgi:1-acyl-sn-glycerol-3-phosphate acyltransferase
MPQIIQQAQPGLDPIPVRFSPIVVRLVHWLLPLFMRVRLWPWLPAGIVQVDVRHIERLLLLLQQFQQGKIRLMLAFRHVEVDDPLAGLYLLSRAIPQAAQQQSVPLQYPLHTHFFYDRGMPLWGGSGLGWMLSQMGGVSIRRGKQPDRQALKAARSLFVNGAFPFAIAPEGATNGHSEWLSPLEPGVAQLGFWAVEDLQKAGRAETVWILPIGVQYSYVDQPWDKLDQLMSELEAHVGILPSPQQQAPQQDYYQRLLHLGETVLTKMEQFYQRFYHRSIPQTESDEGTSSQDLTQRLQTLLEQALQVAEEFFGLNSQGQFPERCRRLEEASWNYIYRSDIADLEMLSPLDRGLADWIAQAASLQIIHMRLVESLVAVTGEYVQTKPSFDRLAEVTLLMFDVTARLRGDKLPARPRLGDRRVQLTIAQPLSVSDRAADYQTDRQGARGAIAQLTQDIQTALNQTIE